MKVLVIDNGISVVPETDFEKDYLMVFMIHNKRKVIVKSGTGLDDLQSINIIYEKEEEYKEGESQVLL